MKNKKIIGSVIGALFSILLIYIGFWKTILIGIGTTTGFVLAGGQISYNLYKEKIIIIFEKLVALKIEYLGALFGIFIAILIINIGFWRTIFTGICAFLGYFVIKKFSNKQEFFEFLDRILPQDKF